MLNLLVNNKEKIVSDDFTADFIQIFKEITQVLLKPFYSS